jgi:hypothetical protein
MKTCLIIDAQNLEELVIDGPAIRIRLIKKSSRLFPLRRLSRIHISGNLSVGFNALIACAECQIPVTFFTIRGKFRCQLYYPMIEKTWLAHWIDIIEYDIDAKTQYEEWLAHQTLHLLAGIGEKNGAHNIRLELVREKINFRCMSILGEIAYRETTEWINGLLLAHLAHVMVVFGLSNKSRGYQCLQGDILPLCQIWLYHYLILEVETNLAWESKLEGISKFYQRYAESIEYLVRRMLIQLSSRLESIV